MPVAWPIDENGLALAGGGGMHPPVGEAFDAADGEHDDEDDLEH